MGLMTGALQIGQNALLSYQSALQVVGNNVANAGVDGYVRQSPQLTSMPGVTLTEGLMPGGGVALTALQRHMDEALETRLRDAAGQEQNSTTRQQALSQVESLYNELSGDDLSSLMSNFFNSFTAVQNNPGGDNSRATRVIAITAGETLANRFHDLRTGLVNIQEQLNKQVTDSANQANQLSQQIAGLNVEIVQAEATGKGSASSLRDQRDGALKDLSKLMDIQTVATPEGAVNVYVGSQPLVQYSQSRGLVATQDSVGGSTVATVRFADDKGSVQIRSGQIAGLVSARDQDLAGQIQQLDSLASTLIQQVNRLHSEGQGLNGLTDVTGAYSVADPGAALSASAAGLPFPAVNGSFKITVQDTGTGATQEYVVPVSQSGAGTSLNDLVNYISANVNNVSASLTSDNRLRLQASPGQSFTFSEDSSGALAGLGMNVLFTGYDARDIGVETGLTQDPARLAAGLANDTANRAGDGSNAARIASLAEAAIGGAKGTGLSQQWQATVGSLASASAAARHDTDATHSVSQSLQAQRESISGVNMDEESVSLMQYQRSFQAAARYITVVDQLVQEMLSMVR
jgi:flagellar hook-associated protein 1